MSSVNFLSKNSYEQNNRTQLEKHTNSRDCLSTNKNSRRCCEYLSRLFLGSFSGRWFNQFFYHKNYSWFTSSWCWFNPSLLPDRSYIAEIGMKNRWRNSVRNRVYYWGPYNTNTLCRPYERRRHTWVRASGATYRPGKMAKRQENHHRLWAMICYRYRKNHDAWGYRNSHTYTSRSSQGIYK